MCYKWTFIVFILFFSCKSSKVNNRVKYEQLHQKKLKLLEVLPEPLAKDIPDSMKRYIDTFRKVKIEDQRYRRIRAGSTKGEMEKQKVLDSINLGIVKRYIDQYGWPDARKCGFIVSSTVFTVVQHSSLAYQRECYPALVKAYQSNNTYGEYVALLEDRINVRNNRLQYYGTQVISYKGRPTMSPVVNVDSLEEYRKRIGLIQTMPEYFKIMGYEYDLQFYKREEQAMLEALKIRADSVVHTMLEKTRR